MKKYLLIIILSVKTLFLFSQTTLPVDFEGGPGSVTLSDFDGGSSVIMSNPNPSGINTSNYVAQHIRNGGQVWAGTYVGLSTPLDFTTNNTIRLKSYSPTAGTPVLLKLESADGTQYTELYQYTTVANQWEELSWNFGTQTSGIYTKIVIFYNFNTLGDGSANSTYYFDDVEFFEYVPTPQAPPLGNALRFDGHDDYIQLDELTLTTGAITIEAWMKYDSLQYWSRIVEFANGEELDNIIFANYQNTNTLRFESFDGNSMTFIEYANALETDVWMHLAVTLDASGNAYLYKNGELLTSKTGLNPVKNVTRLYNYVGKSMWTWDSCLNGTMDELRVWTTVRTQTQIQDNMYNYLNGDETGLLIYYRYDEGESAQNNSIATGHNIVEAVDYANCYIGTLKNFQLNDSSSNWIETGDDEAPILMTNEVYPLWTRAELSGNIFSIGETDVTTRGFQYALDRCFTTGVVTLQETGTFSTGEYSIIVDNLIPETTYYVRAFATNSKGTTYAETRKFITIDEAPGECLDFDGSDDYVDFGSDASLNFGVGGFTIQSFVNTTAAADMCIISKTGDGMDYLLGINSTGTAYFSVGGISCESSTTINDGLWHNITGVKLSGNIYIYVDGILENSIANGTTANPSGNLVVGSYNNTNFFKGKIDEIRIWNDGLEQETIINSMNQIVYCPTRETNLVAYFRFDDGTGSFYAEDLKGENTGTLINMDVSTDWLNSDAFNIWVGFTDNSWFTANNWSDADGAPGNANAGKNIHFSETNTPDISFNVILQNVVTDENTTFNILANNLLTVDENLFPMGIFNIAASSGSYPGMVTVSRALFVGSNATLNLLTPSNETPSGSLITNGDILGTGVININRYLSVGGRWQYVSCPMNNVSSSAFANLSGAVNPNFYYYNEAYDCVPDPDNDNYTNWYTTDLVYAWTSMSGGLSAGTGYALYDAVNRNAVFTGTPANLNNGSYTVALTFNPNDGNDNYFDGWNFVGNPYPSALDWNASGWDKSDINNTVYYWDGDIGNYKYFNGTGGTMVDDESYSVNGGSQYIPAMQGFFVKATQNGSFGFSNESRVHAAQQLWKSKVESDFEYIKIKVSDEYNHDETVVRFSDFTKDEFDYEYDAFKMFPNNNIPMVFTILDNQTPTSINSLYFPDEEKIVPLGFYTNNSGVYTFNIQCFETEMEVYLVDNLMNECLQLRKNENYTFYSTNGDFRNRFKLIFKKMQGGQTTDNESILNTNSVIVYPNPVKEKITILAPDNYGKFNIEITDLSGKTVYQKNNILPNNSIDLSNLSKGIYILNIKSANGILTKKIIKE